MRIVAGNLGGRQFEATPGKLTHPMSEKARGGLFNTLGSIEGLSVLDAFAGTGALSFEALSRGAKHSTAIDLDRHAKNVIQKNSQQLGLKEHINIIMANISTWSDNNPDMLFDLVLCDPPYDKLRLAIIQKLTRHVRPNGLLVLSWPGKITYPLLKGLSPLKNQNYGDAQLVFYRNIS